MILKKAWLFCWLAIPFLWLLPTIDIQQHDTYYVIGPAPLALLFGPVLFVEGYIYWVFRNKNFKKWLTAFHLLSIFFLFAFWMSFTSWMNLLIPPPSHRYYSFETFQAENTNFWHGGYFFWGFLALIFILFLLGQLAFIVNLVLSRKER